MTTVTEFKQAGERPTLIEPPTDLGFEAPTEREFKALMKIVMARMRRRASLSRKPMTPSASFGLPSRR